MDVMEMVEMKVVNVVLWVVGGCKLKSDPVLTVVQEKIFQVLRKCRGQYRRLIIFCPPPTLR